MKLLTTVAVTFLIYCINGQTTPNAIYSASQYTESTSRVANGILQTVNVPNSLNPFYVMHLYGNATERGYAHGQLFPEKIVDFVDISRLKPLKIVINSGNGAAGPTFDALAEKLVKNGVEAEFIRVHHTPDAAFPNGIPNPLLPQNHAATSDVVKANNADFGVAFDGDFDRCFFFDEQGVFVPGEYVVGLLSKAYLRKEPDAKIVHDPRVIWNTLDAVKNAGGTPIEAKTGHAFIKQAMRKSEAVYGGEMSAHHYFRDFAYCDSGMIPWLLVWELISTSGKSLGQLLKKCRANFPSSGELNFRAKDPAACLKAAEERYGANALSVDHVDGVSITFEDWRFNLRKSNTEPLVRLNVETRGDVDLLVVKTAELQSVIEAQAQ